MEIFALIVDFNAWKASIDYKLHSCGGGKSQKGTKHTKKSLLAPRRVDFMLCANIFTAINMLFVSKWRVSLEALERLD